MEDEVAGCNCFVKILRYMVAYSGVKVLAFVFISFLKIKRFDGTSVFCRTIY